MNKTQYQIDSYRTWLANPKNASHPDRAEVERDLSRLEGRAPVGATDACTDPESALAAGIVALYSEHTGPDHRQAGTGFTAASPLAASLPNHSVTHHGSGSEEQLAASIIATLNAHRSA